MEGLLKGSQAGYRQWLERQKYQANTIAAQLHRAGRVEEYHGDLDDIILWIGWQA